MKQLPNGISNYEKIKKENFVYVDKTQYIEKLENISNPTIMFLRPKKFGKTLFTSTLECYYDKLKSNDFDILFKDTYIGKNPTSNKNRYCILRFNFSGINSDTKEGTMHSFRREVASSINTFVQKYGLDFYINEKDAAEDILDNLFKAFLIQKGQEQIYVIIDEYDHFANELLGFRTDEFKNLIMKNGLIRKWYEILKKGTETVVDRIFITGVAPITLDSMTSGFNISRDLSKNIKFNDMLGFTKEEVIYLMDAVEIDKEKQKELLPIIKQNYDGYIFSDDIEEEFEKYRIYNSNMTLYFLNEYVESGKIPAKLVDVNIISDYNKIEGMINLCQTMGKMEILEKIITDEEINSNIIEKFNPEINFGETELVSLLYYLGYLTIVDKGISKLKLKAPNDVIKEIYIKYFMEYIDRQVSLTYDGFDTEAIVEDIVLEGKIDSIIELLGKYLTNLSNRDYVQFSEKYVKIIFYTISKMLGAVYVKSELEIGGKYSDILILPKEKIEERYGVLIEFKYIKQEDYEKDNSLLEQKQKEAKEQLLKYKKTEEIKNIPNLRSYSVVAIKDKLIFEEV